MPFMREFILSLFLFIGGASGASAAEGVEPSLAQPDHIEPACAGALTQGGLVICHARPGTEITVAGTTLRAAADGSAQFGLTRSAPALIGYTIGTETGDLSIARRMDESTILTDIPCDKIDARTEAQKAHAAQSWQKKQAGWARFHEGEGALNGFIRPAEGRLSSPFGFTRRYVTEGCPEKVKPHLGYDIAAPIGAPVIAPAAGTVILAETDLYYEGGTVFLDHGHGLVSVFLHMSEVDVKKGDVLETGDAIGKVGASGRVTGPHLHWAVKWRNLGADNRKGDYYIDPALLLELPKTQR